MRQVAFGSLGAFHGSQTALSALRRFGFLLPSDLAAISP
jgi:hypothetical protein